MSWENLFGSFQDTCVWMVRDGVAAGKHLSSPFQFIKHTSPVAPAVCVCVLGVGWDSLATLCPCRFRGEEWSMCVLSSHKGRRKFSTGSWVRASTSVLQGRRGRRQEPGRGAAEVGRGASGGPGEPRGSRGGSSGDYVSPAGRQRYLCNLGSPVLVVSWGP